MSKHHCISIKRFIREGSVALENISPSTTIDCEILLAHALQKDRSFLFTWPERNLSEKEYFVATSLLERRRNGEPIAYIIGRKDFWDFQLAVTPATLIPRPETELIIETAIELSTSNEFCLIADLGTGSGAIAIAIAREMPCAKVFAVDLCSDAVKIAEKNALNLNVHNVAFYTGSWFTPLNGNKFDLIVSNPPYVKEDDPHLRHGDLRFEPKTALASGENGLDDILSITTDSINHLNSGGWLVFEHGFEQKQGVQEILINYGFSSVRTIKDIQCHDRVSLGQYLHR